MDHDRLNSPSTSSVSLEVLGHQLQFSQDPNSKHLGTTVWDASIVFVKFLEKNSRKGRFSPAKLKGKRAIELGAGCGLAGFGMALLGCSVVSTDQIEVLPLLMRNVERNAARVKQTNTESVSLGPIQVAELDWGNADHIRAVDPPFDYIIGTDIVYAEHLLEPLLQTLFALSGRRTTILLGYEIRSTTVHEKMMDMWKSNFEVKTIPRTKMDIKYQYASIQLFTLASKTQPGSAEKIAQGHDVSSSECVSDEDESCASAKSHIDCGNTGNSTLEGNEVGRVRNGMLSDWEARRYGSIAARLLRDVKIT